jgi:predicted DCC family thiol-disulfide oxidoreductase YuxK
VRGHRALYHQARPKREISLCLAAVGGGADDSLSSVLLIVNNTLHSKSRAALQILKRLDGAWPVVYYLFFWVPPFIGNPLYDFIGNRRYQWFGRKEECWLPTPELKKRFLADGVEPN